MSLKPGDIVRARVFGGGVVRRRVVEIAGNGVLLTRPEEYEAALRDGREPSTVGFPIWDVELDSLDLTQNREAPKP